MSEIIDVYTKNGIKIGSMTKKEYYFQLKEDIPWIKCTTCFVIDETNKKILVEKRGKTVLDSGKIDLCSGHVQTNEPPFMAMRRELEEELSIPFEESNNLYLLGSVNVDYTILENEDYKNRLKCFVNIYALKLKNISKIKPDNTETTAIGWLSFEDVCNFIRYHMTRMPYEGDLIEQYEKVFKELEKFLFPEKIKEGEQNLWQI